MRSKRRRGTRNLINAHTTDTGLMLVHLNTLDDEANFLTTKRITFLPMDKVDENELVRKWLIRRIILAYNIVMRLINDPVEDGLLPHFFIQSERASFQIFS